MGILKLTMSVEPVMLIVANVRDQITISACLVISITPFYITNNVSVDALIHLKHSQQELTLLRASPVRVVLINPNVSSVEMEQRKVVLNVSITLM